VTALDQVVLEPLELVYERDLKVWRSGLEKAFTFRSNSSEGSEDQNANRNVDSESHAH
jgi:hypothetical protein